MHTVPLLSWDFVYNGACYWTDQRQRVPCDVPEGIELRAEPATLTGPVLRRDRPWEADGFGWAQVMADEGRYRMWYGCIHAGEEMLCYAESDDGRQWRKPDMRLVEVDGDINNNVVHKGLGAAAGYVCKDPIAPPEARYRCMMFRAWWEGEPGEILTGEEGNRRLALANAARPGDPVLPHSVHGKMMGMISPDGLQWTLLENPILDEWHDSHNICMYDPMRKKYVGYFRGFYGTRRAIAFSETEDFAHWPPARVIHHHDIGDEPSESLYSNGFTFYPGNPGIRLMFPGIYHQGTDRVYGQLAVSLDGLNWSRFSRQASIPTGGPGTETEGHVYPLPGLLRFSREGKFRLLCMCGPHYHNESFNPALRVGPQGSSYFWAEWPEDRLAGIHAPAEGAFTLWPEKCGDRLLANYRAAPDGWVRFELVDRLACLPIPRPGIAGHTFAESDALSGDRTHAPVTWNGSPDLSRLRGSTPAIRVQLYKATLFSLTVYGIDEPLVREDPRFPV